MSESELRALIRSELLGLNIEVEPVEDVIERIMDAASDYARERESDAASDAVREYEERM